MMKKTLSLLFASSLALSAAETVASLYDGQLKMAESEIVSLAEAVPESAYNFAPKQGAFQTVRTFGAQLKHVAAVAYLCAATASKEKVPVDLGKDENGPDSIKTKAQIVQYLKDSFAYAHKSMAKLTAENQLEAVPAPFPGAPPMMRGELSSLIVSHTFDHYGQIVVYARMNNVVPPASVPPPPAPPAGKKK
ncbi:MAG: DinB family protein [Candidatus Solibacter sp.]